MKGLLLIFTICLSGVLLGQKSFTLSGYVKDDETGEALIGAAVFVKETGKGTVTNVYGFYSLTVPGGDYTLQSSYVGYNDYVQTIALTEDLRINISIQPSAALMEEVVIEAEASDANITGTQMGEMNLNMDKVKTLPAFMGEVDVLKTVQFLPGVQSGGEGNTGFYVRGGGPDQNLILLDEAPVYNAAHLFGFFSVFNADAIKNVKLIKGGMPAQYGGRLSSVLDISMKDGNYRETHGSGGIGLIASRFTIEGPIKKDTSSFIISARRTYVDVLMEPFIKDDAPLKGSGYFFYDLTAKLNYRLSDKDRLFLSGYFGRDVFNFKDSNLGLGFKVPWGNATASFRWNHLFSDKLFVNTTAIFTDYEFGFSAEQAQFSFSMNSGIRDYTIKQDYSYFWNTRNSIKFGWNVVRHRFIPTSVSGSSGDTELGFDDEVRIYANEPSLYIQDEIEINEALKVNVGLRYAMFQQVGPFTRYYKNSTTGVTDSTQIWEKNKNVVFYQGLEPRMNLRYLFKDQSSLKAGFTRNNQFVHLATMSSVSLPTDLWFPSSELVKPQIGMQYSLGYFKNFQKNKYEASVELYYKNLNNLIEYKENAQPDDNVNNNVDNQLTFGNGYSYGAEFFIKKALGDFNGWVGYTWSKTMRSFEDINEGREFPAKYDRRHDLSVVLQYDFNEKWNIGAAFVYATGSAITLPEKRYYSPTENRIITVWSDRNAHRMIPYHRADLSLTYKGKEVRKYVDPETGEEKEKQKRLISSWNLSVYNLYNRANPYFIFFDYSGDPSAGNLDVNAYQVSLFPILPSITWNFKF